MDNFAKILFAVAAVGFIIDMIHVVRKMIPIIKRLREVKQVNKDLNVISVMGEIVEVNETRLNQWDIQYDVKLYYEVGYEKHFKDIVLINKQSIRTGQKVTLLCDSDNPENAVFQLGNEKEMLGGYIFNLVVASIGLIIDLTLNILEIKMELG